MPTENNLNLGTVTFKAKSLRHALYQERMHRRQRIMFDLVQLTRVLRGCDFSASTKCHR
jgi:hypothetical protein